jgi:subtilisin family serine protease
MWRLLPLPALAAIVAAHVAEIFAASDMTLDQAAQSKLDAGLDQADRSYPVFVRMAEQLIPGAGDYERFCEQHRLAKRTELRRTVLATLHRNSDDSWRAIGDVVNRLQSTSQIKDVERFWIINGFACDATGDACRQLAAHEAVSFVYLQRGPIRQHARQASGDGLPAEQQKQVYAQVLSDWKDDSDEPFSVDGLEIPWNVERVQAPAAWTQERATGKGVTVALCDSGMMVAPALVRALWRNPREELNDKDDDGNGHVDDLFGYDFQDRSFYALGDSPTLPHGSMCAGIIAGRPINSKNLVTGIAPRARLMILRGMGHLKAYEYALQHEADVLSLSYMWVNMDLGNYRGVYRTAHEHLAAGGVVAVGGAGNFAHLPRGRQIALPKDIPCVIAAGGILQDGSKAPQSSEGPCYWQGVKFYDDYPDSAPLGKPDVTGFFGGYPVWARPAPLGPRWQLVSKEGPNFALVIGPQGNSFSGPHAAGVAALMLSANPELTAWQTKALMEQTCKDLGEPGRDHTFGAGLLQAHAAVRAARDAAK